MRKVLVLLVVAFMAMGFTQDSNQIKTSYANYIVSSNGGNVTIALISLAEKNMQINTMLNTSRQFILEVSEADSMPQIEAILIKYKVKDGEQSNN